MPTCAISSLFGTTLAPKVRRARKMIKITAENREMSKAGPARLSLPESRSVAPLFLAPRPSKVGRSLPIFGTVRNYGRDLVNRWKAAFEGVEENLASTRERAFASRVAFTRASSSLRSSR